MGGRRPEVDVEHSDLAKIDSVVVDDSIGGGVWVQNPNTACVGGDKLIGGRD